MSVLLVGIVGELGETLVARLVGQSDEVRVIEEDSAAGERWKALGAHVAYGLPDDPDLIDRAAQNVRTIVVVESPDQDATNVVAAVVEALAPVSRRGREAPRVVLCGPDPPGAAIAQLESSGLEHVVLRTGRRLSRVLRGGRLRIPTEALAEAIDAADDLAGDVSLELDLTDAASWAVLHLDPPWQTRGQSG